jgi:hypothetical protein
MLYNYQPSTSSQVSNQRSELPTRQRTLKIKKNIPLGKPCFNQRGTEYCRICKNYLPKKEFSNNQLKLKAKIKKFPTCKKCIENRRRVVIDLSIEQSGRGF